MSDKGYGSEGEVMYFVNNKGHVIGLLKKKTAWYVLARAIREKARNAVRTFVKNPSEPGNFFNGNKLMTPFQKNLLLFQSFS